MSVPPSRYDASSATHTLLLSVLGVKNRLASGVRSAFREACEFKRDVGEAVCNPDVLPASERRIYELKVVAGAISTISGAFNGSIGFVGGVAAVVDGVYHLGAAGRQYRLAHPVVPT